MKRTSTLKQLTSFTQNEQELRTELLGAKQPKKSTLANILNYSKALSVRKSENLDYLEFVLN